MLIASCLWLVAAWPRGVVSSEKRTAGTHQQTLSKIPTVVALYNGFKWGDHSMNGVITDLGGEGT
jgi:hypothetical protein